MSETGDMATNETVTVDGPDSPGQGRTQLAREDGKLNGSTNDTKWNSTSDTNDDESFIIDARSKASQRGWAPETTDERAIEDMLEYIKCDASIQDTNDESEIAAFYAGRSVLITGATGFLGKCLLEKLMRSCPGIEQVFILMRPKKGKEVSKRVEDLLKTELFERLRNLANGQQQLNKIRALEGDVTRPLFGLGDEQVELLSSKVSVILHTAATVKFIEPMKAAIENNVVSVNNLLQLAKRMTKLGAVVHTSTAFSNCDRKQLDEVHYEARVKADKLIDMARWMKPEMLEQISPVLMGNQPNTYTFTKGVAESLIVEQSKKIIPNIPVAIVRPSIVTGIWSQPIRGWVDNFNGAAGLMIALMSGFLQAGIGHRRQHPDVIPVDIVANLVICAAWKIYRDREEERQRSPRREVEPGDKVFVPKVLEENDNVSIYNCVSSPLNPMRSAEFIKYTRQIGWIYPCNRLFRRPHALILSKFVFQVFDFVNHQPVAYFGDFVLLLLGKKRRFVKQYKRVTTLIKTLSPFTSNEWTFTCSNVSQLYETLSPIDKRLFNFDIRQVRWDDFLRRYYIGAKIFALKDDPKKIVRARHNLKRLDRISRMLRALFLSVVFYFFFGKYALNTTKALIGLN